MAASVVDTYAHMPHRKPIPGSATSVTASPYVQTMNSYSTMGQPSRRTLSNATASTSSSTSAPHRTSSNRSGSSQITPTSYVALLRKQKATVWCDRSQTEDPRMLAAQRLAKQRAEREVSGGAMSSGGSGSMGRGSQVAASGGSGSFSGGFTSGMARKIRHHGKPGISAFSASGANLAGAAVPMRLSASEVDDDPNAQYVDEWGNSSMGSGIDPMGRGPHHQRTGSGRSSLGSGRRVGPGPSRLSTASSTPSSGHSRSPSEGVNELEDETPVPTSSRNEYFQQAGIRRGGSGSSSNSDRENSFGGLADIPESDRFERPADRTSKDSVDELRRRGSVDDRAMTMSGVRLYVANPDLSD